MSRRALIIGDAIALLIVTVIGFATHRETNISYLPHFVATYVPLAAAWFLLAPWFGLFEESVTRNARQLWRPALAALFAVPLAVIVRGALLNAAVLPLFALIFGLTNALGMIVWRGIWIWGTRKK